MNWRQTYHGVGLVGSGLMPVYHGSPRCGHGVVPVCSSVAPGISQWSPRSVTVEPPVCHSGAPGLFQWSPRSVTVEPRWQPIFSFCIRSSTSEELHRYLYTTFNMPEPRKGKRATSKPPVPRKNMTSVKTADVADAAWDASMYECINKINATKSLKNNPSNLQ